jgi:hypothetical protein
MSKYKRKPLPIADGTAFIEVLEQGVAEGNADLIAANLPKLKEYVQLYQDRIFQLAQIQFRACTILEQHEPSAAERGLQG